VIGYEIRQELLDAAIPTHSFYHEEALESDEAQQAFAFLTLIASPRDRVSLRFLLGCRSGSWLGNQYKLVRDHCEEYGAHPWDALEQLEAGTLDLGRTSEIVARFESVKERLPEFEDVTIEELIDGLFPEGQEWSQVIREMALLGVDDIDTSDELLDHVRTKITQPEMPEAGEFVRIMSLHKSKGLTAKAVIVCACIEGLIPFRNEGATPAEQRLILREQRRLFYVAITRCTRFLAVSSTLKIESKMAYKIGAKTTGRGRTVKTIASQFLRELGPSAPPAILGDDLLAAM
jgi:superfamily I DNA/RNA helicase